MGLKQRIYEAQVRKDQAAVDKLNRCLRLEIEKKEEKENGTDVRENHV